MSSFLIALCSILGTALLIFGIYQELKLIDDAKELYREIASYIFCLLAIGFVLWQWI